MKKTACLLLFLWPLFSCDKEEEIRSSELQVPVVTGFRLIDPYGAQIGWIGTPNDRGFSTSSMAAIAYPNPSTESFEITLWSQVPVKGAVWLTPATFDNSLSSYSLFNATPIKVGGAPLRIADNLQITGSMTPLRVDVTKLPSGPYRLYVQMGEELSWQNILI